MLADKSIDSNSIKLPYIMKNKILLAPGVWNDNYYDAISIKEAFENTDWNNKDIKALFLDHQDKRTSEWIGWVENPRLEGSKIVGDLAIWDRDLAIKVGVAGMRCGISPKVKGHEDLKTKAMTDFGFENFSVVINPACKTAYINLSEGGKMGEEENKVEETQPEVKEEEKPVEAPVKPEAPAEDKSEDTKEAPAEAKPAEEAKEELSDRDFTDMLSSLSEKELSAWTDFVAKKRKENPGMGMKEIAAAFKKEKGKSDELAQLSKDEIISRMNELTAALKSKDIVSPEELSKIKMEQSIKTMSEEIKELRVKLLEPDKKSVKELGFAPIEPKVSADTAMWNFLRKSGGM